MNRLTFINILLEATVDFQNNQLDSIKYIEIINNASIPNYDSNQISYNETKFLYLLFDSLPYYKIPNFLNTFINYLKQITSNKKTAMITKLLESYITELKVNINKRLATEIDLHIYQLAISYLNNSLNPPKVIEILKKNISKSKYLTSMEIAENINFEQNTLYFFKEEQLNLNEIISQKNYQKSSSINKNTQNFILKHFTNNTLEDFISYIIETILSSQDEELIDFFINIFTKELNNIYTIILKKWQSPKKKTKNIKGQYSLF